MATTIPPAVAAPAAPTTPAPVAAPASRTIQLNVTDPDLIAEIDSWQDGEAYTFNVTQSTKDNFAVTDAYGEEVAEEAPAPAAANGTNPAINNLLGKAA